MTRDERTERRYLALVRLGASLLAVSDWDRLTASVARGLSYTMHPVPVRLWAILPDGPQEVSHHPRAYAFGPRDPRDLRRAAAGILETADGHALVGLQAPAGPAAVLEVVTEQSFDAQLLSDALPIIASRAASLAAQGIGGLLHSPAPMPGDLPSVCQGFSRAVKPLIDHDRLSIYLLTPDGRAVERFGVAASAPVPGESSIVPFAEFGLRHILLTNRALVSDELGTDPRIAGREDRLIAAAGFHGLLSVPMRLEGQPFGVLSFVSRSRGFYRAEDMPLAQQVADQSAVFVNYLSQERIAYSRSKHEALEHERRRLAGALHGTLALTLPAISETAGRLAEGSADAEGAAAAGEIARQAATALTEVRRLLVGAVPAALDSHSLREVMTSGLSALEEAGITATLTVEGAERSLPHELRRALFLAFEEAVSNVVLHSRAKKVDVRLTIQTDLTLSITDDGVGFDTAVRADAQGGSASRSWPSRRESTVAR